MFVDLIYLFQKTTKMNIVWKNKNTKKMET